METHLALSALIQLSKNLIQMIYLVILTTLEEVAQTVHQINKQLLLTRVTTSLVILALSGETNKNKITTLEVTTLAATLLVDSGLILLPSLVASNNHLTNK